MARPKQKAQRLGRAGAAGSGERGESSSEPLRVHGRHRRRQAHSGVLRELRQIERHMQPAVARLPFQRLVREICEEWGIVVRWTPSALMCLQEITEDWLVDFFEDAYILVAHAHRLTIQPRDFEALRRVRYRYDQLLIPGPLSDRRSNAILSIPPLHPRRATAEPTSAVHDRDTRSQSRRRENSGEDILIPTIQVPRRKRKLIKSGQREKRAQSPPQQEAPLPQPQPQPQPQQQQETPEINRREINSLRNEEFDLEEIQIRNDVATFELHAPVNWAFTIGSEVFSQRVVGSLDRFDLHVLGHSERREMTDAIVKPALCYCLSLLPLEVQESTFFLNSLISVQLMDNRVAFLDCLQWFSTIDFEKAKLVIFGYHEERHWSLFGYDVEKNICYLANSSGGYHGHVRECARKFVCCIEHIILQPDLVQTMQIRRLRVPAQPDDTSCGWRTCLNAYLLIKRTFNIPDDLRMDTYEDIDVRSFRIKAIQRIVVAIRERGQEEIDRAEEFARERQQRIREQDERHRREVEEHVQAIEQFETLQAEVDEWRSIQDRIAMQEAVEAQRIVEEEERRRHQR